MNFKKRVNGSWTDTPYYIHKTDTDILTTLPADIYANDTTATVGLKGNMSQSGTPTPDNPIMPQECGERTGNLADITTFQDNMSLDATTGLPISTGNNRIANVTPIDVTSNATVKVTFVYNGQLTGVRFMYSVFNNGALIERVANKSNGDTINVQNADKLYICIYTVTKEEISNLMASEGSGSVPYEPYGYKIPISSANTTTPVYLGEVETTRKVKKLVLTGEEEWQFFSDVLGAWQFYIHNISLGGVAQSSCVSNIAPYGVTATTRQRYDYGCYLVTSGNGVAFQMKGAKDTFRGITAWKAYLTQQYANGTPVCVWYVLATETTGIVNEPLRKIGDYADEVSGITIPTIAGANSFDVLTTLKPSEVSLTYTGWHDASVKEWDGSQWD